MDKEDTTFLSRFSQKHVTVEVLLRRGVLSWRDERSRSSGISNTSGGCDVQVGEIVAVQEVDGRNNTEVERTTRKQHVQICPHGFKVFYVTRSRRHRWRCSDVTFYSDDHLLCKKWINAINNQLLLMTNRPKNLLVYINPYGGKQCGKLIYEQKVAPLFRCACISADVIVTERANHAREHLRTEADLDKYDGVVCVGGDGMFSEVLHGLVTRMQNDHNINLDQPDTEFVPSPLRIGIIPAGSTDCICFTSVGTNDPVTSALHIIIGDSQPMDVCSVHHGNTFLRCSVSLLGYGFYGDMLVDSERMRWLGPARYDLSGVKTFLSLNNYEGTVSFLPADDDKGNPRDERRCRTGCDVCQHQNSSERVCSETSEESGKPDEGRWVEISGKFISINAASMSCACPRSPQGISPSAHLADGTTDLILVSECSRSDFLRHLFRHTNKDDQFDHPFVQVHRVRRFRFRSRRDDPVPEVDPNQSDNNPVAFSPSCLPARTCDHGQEQSSWSCDGEILPHASIQVSVQRQLIRLFARGIEDQQPSPLEDPFSLWTQHVNS